MRNRLFILLPFLLIVSGVTPCSAGDALDAPDRFVVEEDGGSLVQAAVFLYGNAEMWKDIAQWNQLQKPWHVNRGQTLLLQRRRTLTDKQGAAALLAFWREKLQRRDRSLYVAAVEKLRNDPESKPNEAENLLQQGERKLARGKYAAALESLRAARMANENSVPAWLNEIRTLRKLGRKEEEQEVKAQFLKKFPNLSRLPAFAETSGMKDKP